MKPKKLPGVSGLKEMLRRQMRTRLAGMTGEDRAFASLELCRRAAQLPAFRDAKALALFAPLATEPDIHPLIEEAWARGKQVVFPLMSREAGVPRLDWHAVKAWNEVVVTGPFGVREPEPSLCPRVDPLELDCIFVPGLAFDERGDRLGRGGGYYDVALTEFDVGTPRIGLMFACQQTETIPRDTHDQMLEGVVTEDGFVLVE
jgi:5-formyltetrahydrofolate cyclo-ligase